MDPLLIGPAVQEEDQEDYCYSKQELSVKGQLEDTRQNNQQEDQIVARYINWDVAAAAFLHAFKARTLQPSELEEQHLPLVKDDQQNNHMHQRANQNLPEGICLVEQLIAFTMGDVEESHGEGEDEDVVDESLQMR